MQYELKILATKDGRCMTLSVPGKPKALLVFTNGETALMRMQLIGKAPCDYDVHPLTDEIIGAAMSAGCKDLAHVVDAAGGQFRLKLDPAAIKEISDQLKKDPTLSQFDPHEHPSPN